FRGGLSSVLTATPVDGGPEQRISTRSWYGIQALRWLPDGHGLIATANAQYPLYQVWYITYPGGQARSITNDLNSYSGVSLTADAAALVTVQRDTMSHLWVAQTDDAGRAREISTGRLDGLNEV